MENIKNAAYLLILAAIVVFVFTAWIDHGIFMALLK